MKIIWLRNFILVIGVLFSAMGQALELDEAKQKGWVGEKDNGYLALIVEEQGVQALVSDVNSKRQKIYLDLAAKNKITMEQVEKLAAQKAYAKTLPGHYIWVNGTWVKK